jgi:hypothetical protein
MISLQKMTNHQKKQSWRKARLQIQADLKAINEAMNQLPEEERQRWIENGTFGAMLLLLSNSEITWSWVKHPTQVISALAESVVETSHPDRWGLAERVKGWNELT